MSWESKPISPLWLLADRLSVIEAALLLIDFEPQGVSDNVENWTDSDKPSGYVAARRAVLSAILKEKVEGAALRKFEEDMRGHTIESDQFDYEASWVETESLRDWLKSRDFQGGLFADFSRDNDAPGYLDSNHHRYAPKLAAAVEAWQNFREDDGTGTAKQKLTKWVRINAGRFGLVDDDGKPAESVIQDIAKVANWAPSGGAPKRSKETGPGFDDEIPF